MSSKIKRRDFLNGIAIGAGTSLLAPYDVLAQTALPEAPLGKRSIYYPPTLTGMRGSHPGSFEVAHALSWDGEKPVTYQKLDEHYDLVVVGAGMSGLAAAWFYRKKMGPHARILILDNHDDFGGHAKRNEFHHNGRMVLSLGGAQNLENPSAYSDVAKSVLHDIGIDKKALESMADNTPKDYALAGNLDAGFGMSLPGAEGNITVGGNWNKFMRGVGEYKEAIRSLPIPAEQQDKLIDFFGGARDYLDDLSLSQKYDYINSVSYNQFLVDRIGIAKDTLPILESMLRIYSGLTGWNLTVLEAFASIAPGLQSLGWLGRTLDSLTLSMADQFFDVRMFPDGNASIARLLVHKLIPNVAPDSSGFNDIAVSRFHYDELDKHNQATRLRLNSTVVGARNIDHNKVEVDYVAHGKALRITANHCILACNNGIIPHMCPELPEEQKEALLYGVKVPFVYANVLLENGQAFSKLGVNTVSCPYDPFQIISSAPTMSVGGYEPPRGPEDPMVVFMMSAPTPAPTADESGRDLLRIGRYEVYATSFETYEQRIRNQLQALLGQHGFNHETDIRAITVNRIPHGYAYSYLALDDPEWEEGQAPHEIGRTQFGRISIANADSQAEALMDYAFDAAWRAVEEQIS